MRSEKEAPIPLEHLQGNDLLAAFQDPNLLLQLQEKSTDQIANIATAFAAALRAAMADEKSWASMPEDNKQRLREARAALLGLLARPARAEAPPPSPGEREPAPAPPPPSDEPTSPPIETISNTEDEARENRRRMEHFYQIFSDLKRQLSHPEVLLPDRPMPGKWARFGVSFNLPTKEDEPPRWFEVAKDIASDYSMVTFHPREMGLPDQYYVVVMLLDQQGKLAEIGTFKYDDSGNQEQDVAVVTDTGIQAEQPQTVWTQDRVKQANQLLEQINQLRDNQFVVDLRGTVIQPRIHVAVPRSDVPEINFGIFEERELRYRTEHGDSFKLNFSTGEVVFDNKPIGKIHPFEIKELKREQVEEFERNQVWQGVVTTGAGRQMSGTWRVISVAQQGEDIYLAPVDAQTRQSFIEMQQTRQPQEMFEFPAQVLNTNDEYYSLRGDRLRRFRDQARLLYYQQQKVV